MGNHDGETKNGVIWRQTPWRAPGIDVHFGAKDGRFMSPLPMPPKMEDEVADAVARFVLEVGGIKKGVCNHSKLVFMFAQSSFQRRQV